MGDRPENPVTHFQSVISFGDLSKKECVRRECDSIRERILGALKEGVETPAVTKRVEEVLRSEKALRNKLWKSALKEVIAKGQWQG
jgi:hypothetical protein